MSLTRRLLLSYITIVVATAAVLTVAADRGLRSQLEARLTEEFEREARYLAFAARGLAEAELDSLAHSLGAQTGRRLTIISRDGRVLADTDFPRDQLGTIENHATRPEVAEALAGRVGIDRRRSTSTGEDELKVALPGPGPGPAAVVRVSARLDQVNEVVRNAQGAVLGGASIALAIAAFLSLGFSLRVARPLRKLSDAAQAIAAGGHPTLDVRGRDEVGQLARALRSLDEKLDSRLRTLELGRAETSAIITSMVEGVIACDAKGHITLMNPAARALLDLDPNSQPPTIHELFRKHEAADAVANALSGQTVSGIETEINGRQVLVSGHSLPNGGAVLVTHDVTWLRRVEAVRRDFVANVSHEMRTPLTVMRGYAETLLSDDPPPDLRARFLRSILEHAQRLQRLVDDLLDLSRIEAGAWQPEPTPVSVEEVAREAWQG
ncbi:MAG TPA: histidine kinase dimerization/phospho-acceptor domain-containing protein, partial [Gemmatimonadales bacterium]|nr:histidine kinase dimerization/phospho-acceptor domain-containing protein [Gemmatimonadales bacterium]